jgi:hypothetical protein
VKSANTERVSAEKHFGNVSLEILWKERKEGMEPRGLSSVYLQCNGSGISWKNKRQTWEISVN